MSITYTAARNPKWSNSEKTVIDIEVNFDHMPETWVDFTAVASGDLPHTHEIYAKAVAGDFGSIADYDGD
tara:strand:+ start:1138 stop:1347 length:210 start_codon:yes stop_codon:yes gene_type:complete